MEKFMYFNKEKNNIQKNEVIRGRTYQIINLKQK